MLRYDRIDRDGSHGIDLYLRDIRDDSLLTPEQEKTLAEAIAAGDSDARTQMIRANLRLVVKISRDYLGRGLSLDDLVGEGNLGLIRAAEEFDPKFGTRFSTYASYWIKQAIRHALTNTTATIRLPAHMVGLLSRWRKTERELQREWGAVPTFDQVADALELTTTQREMVQSALRASRLRLESNSSDEEDAWSPEEASADVETPEARLESEDERQLLRERMERLDERERTIVTLRYGLEGQPPLTLKEVGQRLGVTREWVRKIEMRAVRKLDDAWIGDEPKANQRLAAKTGRSTRQRRRSSAAEAV